MAEKKTRTRTPKTAVGEDIKLPVRNTIVLDHERPLRMDMAVLYDFEDATGKSVLNGDNVDLKSIKELSAIVWAMVGGADCDLTIRQVARLITGENMLSTIETVIGLLYTALPKAQTSTGGEDPGNASGSIG